MERSYISSFLMRILNLPTEKNKSYVSDTLTHILNLLPGKWSIYSYQLVHHGWICTIRYLDKSLFDHQEFFLHSDAGFIDVQSSNKADCYIYLRGCNNPDDVAKTIIKNLK